MLISEWLGLPDLGEWYDRIEGDPILDDPIIEDVQLVEDIVYRGLFKIKTANE